VSAFEAAVEMVMWTSLSCLALAADGAGDRRVTASKVWAAWSTASWESVTSWT
jgi:hypothetical protein